MTETSISRGASPPNHMNQDYDITRMREDDFERLAVYIVPDVPCERGTPARAEKTLPRSLTLKASLVLSVPNQPVSENAVRRDPSEIKNARFGFPGRRCLEYGRDSEGHPFRPLRRTPHTELSQRQIIVEILLEGKSRLPPLTNSAKSWKLIRQSPSKVFAIKFYLCWH